MVTSRTVLAGLAVGCWALISCGRPAPPQARRANTPTDAARQHVAAAQEPTPAPERAPHPAPSTAIREPASPTLPTTTVSGVREGVDPPTRHRGEITGILMAAYGRPALAALLARPGTPISVVDTGAEAAFPLRACRVERLALPQPVAREAATPPATVYRIVIDGELPTRAYPAQLYLNETRVGNLHEIGTEWIAVCADAELVAPGARVGIGFGPGGIEAGFTDPLRASEEPEP